MKKKGLPFMRMDVMTGRYFTILSQKPERVVKQLRKRFKDMIFTPQPNSYKVLATYKDKTKEVNEIRAYEIDNFIESIQDSV